MTRKNDRKSGQIKGKNLPGDLDLGRAAYLRVRDGGVVEDAGGRG